MVKVTYQVGLENKNSLKMDFRNEVMRKFSNIKDLTFDTGWEDTESIKVTAYFKATLEDVNEVFFGWLSKEYPGSQFLFHSYK